MLKGQVDLTIIFELSCTVMAKLEWTLLNILLYIINKSFFTLLTVYKNEVDKSMDKKFCRLYLHKNAFNLIPQQLFYTKANISGSEGKET